MSWRGWVAGGVVVAGVLGGVALWRAVAAAPTQAPPAIERAVVAGRALYATHCAVCHGESGLGDGPSAAGFATKPSNLTDPLVGRMPDEYLHNIIVEGGVAEGLAPTMPPFRGHVSDAQVGELIAFIRTLGGLPADFRAPPVVTVPGAPAQPIFFSHLVHVTRYEIACQYCHADGRRSSFAGLPSVQRCLGCHTIIGQDNPEIMKIHEYARRGEPIPWVRVFKVPEFTYFAHKAHVRVDVECQACHGPIERMRVVGARTGPRIGNDLLRVLGFRPAPPPLSMGWCVDCHRAENRTRDLQAPLDCLACHH